jgi:hypothetical protein
MLVGLIDAGGQLCGCHRTLVELVAIAQLDRSGELPVTPALTETANFLAHESSVPAL